MHLMSLVIACLLFAQGPSRTDSAVQQVPLAKSPTAPEDDAASNAVRNQADEIAPQATVEQSTSAERSEAPAERANRLENVRVVPVSPDSRRVTPEELVARAIVATASDEIPGEPLSLLAALENVRGQAERIAVVHAYWRSMLALAKYGVALDENRRLNEFNPGAAPATSAGTVETARLAAIDAQRRLAQAARLPKSIQLPMPSDRPHVRAYKTRFEEIFSSSVPMERMRLINQKLPLRLQVIDKRAAAVQAAEDVLSALTDPHRPKTVDPTSVTAAVGELARQQRAYLEAVCDYNYEIADYALNIVGREITGRRLVATLIDVKKDPPSIEPRQGGATEMRRQSSVQRAEFTVPLDTPEDGAMEPTLAVEKPPRIISIPESGGEKRPSPPPLPRQTPNDQTLEAETPDDQTPTDREQSGTWAPARGIARLPLEPVERTVFRLPLDDKLSAAQYANLTEAAPAIQAGQLATDLFPILEGIFDDCQLVDLGDCLADREVDDCHRVINAYWLARLRACEYQAHSAQARRLAELVLVVLDRTADPMGAESMLRLRAARLASDADVLEANARLLDAQYGLTLAVQRPLDSSWLLPRTSPRCGPYPLKLDAQPRSLAESWPVRRLAVTIPTLSDVVMSRATAVVEADAARANAVGQFVDGRLPVDAAMGKIQEQSEHTLAFLDALTAYNQSIAEFVVRTNSGAAADISERILKPVDSL